MTQKKMEEQVNAAYKLKIDLVDFVDDYAKITTILIKEVYGQEGYDWYSWFCWENDYGTKDWSNKKKWVGGKLLDHDDPFRARDENGKPICYNFESTWEYLEQLRSKNNQSL